MNKYILTIVDVRQVQRYLFNANELKQNFGASYLVEQATRTFLEKGLPQPHNWLDPQTDNFNPEKIEDGHLKAEVIFSGGGNAAILFADFDAAYAFAHDYSKLILETAPGLEVAIGHTEVNWDERSGMAKAWEKLRLEVMPKRKEGRAMAQPLAGMGVTAECAYTGKPAVKDLEENGRTTLLSAEAFTKHSNVSNAKGRLQNLFNFKDFKPPDEFDQLGGERGRARYIAVIHADGNSMSKRVIAYSQQASDNRNMVERMRTFSASVNLAGMSALQAVHNWLCKVPETKGDKTARGTLQWVIRDTLGSKEMVRLVDLNILPFRPLVYGGDDVTLVCEGRLGLPIAGRLLVEFANQTLIDGLPLFACAGVAIVHTNYPFARAYALATNLCYKAKEQAKKWDKDGSKLSLLHWHYATSGRTPEAWDEIAAWEYAVEKPGDLVMRPIIVTQDNKLATHWQHWNHFIAQIQGFRQQEWAGKRNKLKDLRTALRQGPKQTEAFTKLHGELPDFGATLKDAQKSGWYQQGCVYFDALEADDLLIYPDNLGGVK